jgi:hypothetical protein
MRQRRSGCCAVEPRCPQRESTEAHPGKAEGLALDRLAAPGCCTAVRDFAICSRGPVMEHSAEGAGPSSGGTVAIPDPLVVGIRAGNVPDADPF